MFHLSGTHKETGNSKTQAKAMSSGIMELWQQGQLLDYIIRVEDQEFPAHKLALAAMSDYFRVMLTGNMKESRENFVQLKGVSAKAVKNLLQYIYTRKLDLNEDICYEVLEGAVHLQIDGAIVGCAQFIVQNLSYENCWEVLEISRMYHLNDMEKKVIDFITGNVKGIVQMGKFHHVQSEDLELLIDNWFGSEWDLFLCIKQWISTDSTQRSVHTDSLMKHVRFSLMSTNEVQNVVHTGIYEESKDSEWKGLIEEAINHHQLPVWERVSQTSVQSQIRSKPMVVAFSLGSGVQCSSEFYGLHDDQCWRKLPNMTHTFPKASVKVVNNFLFVFGGHPHDDPFETLRDCFVFDPLVLRWFSLASMDMGRIDFPVVQSSQKLYVLGGCCGYDDVFHHVVTAKSEVFNIKTNTWSCMQSLPRALCKHAACSHDGFVYVSGGYTEEHYYMTSSHLVCYDIAKDTWEQKASMVERRADHSMFQMKLDGEDALLVIGDYFDMEYYSLSDDQWTMFSTPYSKSPPIWGKTLLDGNSSIYVIAGSKNLDYSDTSDSEDESSIPRADICAKLKCSDIRDGLQINSLKKLPKFPEKNKSLLCAMLCIPADVIDASAPIPPVI